MNEHGVYAFALVLHERIDAIGMTPGGPWGRSPEDIGTAVARLVKT